MIELFWWLLTWSLGPVGSWFSWVLIQLFACFVHCSSSLILYHIHFICLASSSSWSTILFHIHIDFMLFWFGCLLLVCHGSEPPLVVGCHGTGSGFCFLLVQWGSDWAGFLLRYVSLAFAELAFSSTNESATHESLRGVPGYKSCSVLLPHWYIT